MTFGMGTPIPPPLPSPPIFWSRLHEPPLRTQQAIDCELQRREQLRGKQQRAERVHGAQVRVRACAASSAQETRHTQGTGTCTQPHAPADTSSLGQESYPSASPCLVALLSIEHYQTGTCTWALQVKATDGPARTGLSARICPDVGLQPKQVLGIGRRAMGASEMQWGTTSRTSVVMMTVHTSPSMLTWCRRICASTSAGETKVSTSSARRSAVLEPLGAPQFLKDLRPLRHFEK